DTDMGPDIDDAGALAILHARADNEEANLLAVMISTRLESRTAAICFIDAVDTYYGRPDVPIGLWGGGAFLISGRGYPGAVCDDPVKFPRSLGESKDDVPDATSLY